MLQEKCKNYSNKYILKCSHVKLWKRLHGLGIAGLPECKAVANWQPPTLKSRKKKEDTLSLFKCNIMALHQTENTHNMHQ